MFNSNFVEVKCYFTAIEKLNGILCELAREFPRSSSDIVRFYVAVGVEFNY